MKCRYYKICKIMSEKSMMCTIDGGGSYCGHFRSLSMIENKNKIKRKELIKLNKFLKDVEKNKKIITNLSRGNTHEKMCDSIYLAINFRLQEIITMTNKKMKEINR